MKRIIWGFAIVLVFTVCAGAEGFLTLGYDYGFLGKNDLLESAGARVGYFNLDLGHVFDNGIAVSLKYDHINLEDFEYAGSNARVIAVIPSIGAGYVIKFLEGNLQWWNTLNAGYAVSVRYRLGITDHKASGFAPSFTTSVYYRLKGSFFAGVDLGYRYLKVKYADIAGEPEFDLSGPYCGISVKHIFGQKTEFK